MPASDASQVIDEPIPDRSDITKAKREVYLINLAHDAIMLDRTNRQLHYGERLQKFAATGNVKDLDSPEDDMGVNIGNEYHIHQPMEAPAQEPPAPTPTAAVATAVKSRIWPIVLAAIGGGAIPTAGMLYWMLNNKPTPQPAVRLPDYQLRLEVKDQP